jgi:sec-independent protein translocase protein TatB
MGFDMIFIFLLALILFGPKRLPEMAREAGKLMAEFKRASNDFKYQLQAEIEKSGTGTDAAPPAPQPGIQQTSTQQTSTFTQTLLPPAVNTAISGIDEAHERLMKTARMAFDAQNFTLRPPEPPAVVTPEPEQTGEHSSPVEVQTEAQTDHSTTDSAPANSNSAPQRS